MIIRFSKFIFKSVSYAIAYFVLTAVSIALSIVITREVILSISDCSGLGCFGEGVLILVTGFLIGLIISTIVMFVIHLRLEINWKEDANHQHE